MSWIDQFLTAVNTVQDDGTPTIQRPVINFTGSATVSDDPATKVTTVNVLAGSVPPADPTTAGTQSADHFIRTVNQPANVKEYGAVGNGTANDTAALVIAYGSASDVAYGVGNFKIGTSVTLGTAGATTNHFERGALIHATVAQPVTLHGQIEAADDQQIFSVDAPGAILLPDVANVHPGWFGAGLGGSNDAPAINAAFKATADGATVLFRPVDHHVTAGLTITSRLNIKGHGPTSRIVVGVGVAGSVDILTLAPPTNTGIDGFDWRDILIMPASGTPGRHAIVLDTTADGSYIARGFIHGVRCEQLGGLGLHIVNLPAKADGTFLMVVEKCTLTGSVKCENSGDSIVFDDCNVTGAGNGVEIQSIWIGTRLDALKTSIATSASPQTYSGATLNGAIGVTIMSPAQVVSVTTTTHSGTYIGSPIVVHGTDSSDAIVSESIALTLVNGGETVVGNQLFKTVTSIVVPAQNDTAGTFKFGTQLTHSDPTQLEFASSFVIRGCNITSQAASVLVHFASLLEIQGCNIEQFGTASGTAAVDLAGDWYQVQAPSVFDNGVRTYNSPGPCAVNVIRLDNVINAQIGLNTFGRGAGGTVGILITANCKNAAIANGNPEPYDTFYLSDLGVNTRRWGKYLGGVGPGVVVGQPSAGIAATLDLDLGAGNDGQAAITIAKDVVTTSLLWSPQTSDVPTHDIDIVMQGPGTDPRTGTNADSGAFVVQVPAPAPKVGGGNGVFRPSGILLGGTPRLLVGAGGAQLSSQPGETTTIGDFDNVDLVRVSHAAGLELIGAAANISGAGDIDSNGTITCAALKSSSLGPQGFDDITSDQALTSTSYADLLSVTATFLVGAAEIIFTCTATVSVAAADFRLTLDGTEIPNAYSHVGAVGFPLPAPIAWRANVSAGAHTVKVQYLVGGGGTLNIRPSTKQEGASLLVRQS